MYRNVHIDIKTSTVYLYVCTVFLTDAVLCIVAASFILFSAYRKL